ncbi:DnaD domain protein [Aerococcaceae bacterium DSM 111020]|nr:DnaD domain protein [Aerococcaceae bacterium DSM 111020]
MDLGFRQSAISNEQNEGGVQLSTMYDWFKDGSTNVPNIIFNRFGQLDISSNEMMLILYIMSQLNQGKTVNNFKKIANQLGWSVNEVMELINQLIEKDYLSIELETNESGKQDDHYTLRPFFNQLDQKFYQAPTQEETVENQEVLQHYTGNLVSLFEREFGRVLTPMELQTINQWLMSDNYSPEIIQLALKQAMMHQALNFSYIDKILLNWQKQNITTAYEAQKNIDAFNQRQTKSESTSDSTAYDHFEIPIYKWSE